MVDGIIAAVKKGLPYQVACERNGITRTTMDNWRKKGYEDVEYGEEDTPFARFYLRFVRARAISVQEDMEVLRNAGKPVAVDENGRHQYLPAHAITARM